MAENIDFSGAIENLQQMLSSDDGQSQLMDMLKMFTGDETQSAAPPSAPTQTSGGMDMETIMKISGLIQAMNSDSHNPKTTFLYALKPFLKKDRQPKVEQAAKLIKLAGILRNFRQNNQGGD